VVAVGQDDGMPNVLDRYMKADAAFATFHRDISPEVPRSEEEWRVYLEWADATADYVQRLVDTEREAVKPLPELDRIRRILRAQRPDSMIQLP
jgi:hypothetical protein